MSLDTGTEGWAYQACNDALCALTISNPMAGQPPYRMAVRRDGTFEASTRTLAAGANTTAGRLPDDVYTLLERVLNDCVERTAVTQGCGPEGWIDDDLECVSLAVNFRDTRFGVRYNREFRIAPCLRALEVLMRSQLRSPDGQSVW